MFAPLVRRTHLKGDYWGMGRLYSVARPLGHDELDNYWNNSTSQPILFPAPTYSLSLNLIHSIASSQYDRFAHQMTLHFVFAIHYYFLTKYSL